VSRLNILAGAALAALAISSSALAAEIIDQDQESHTRTLDLFSDGGLAQSFQQTADNVAGAGIYLSANGLGPVDISISLWDALPNQGGAELATGRDTTFSNSHWFDVSWTPVEVTANHTYYLVFTEAYPTNYGIAGDFTNPYGGGIAYAGDGFVSHSGVDYAFRTYADPSYVPPKAAEPGPSGAAPEPAYWALTILGFGIAGATLRRRRSMAAA
jgi:hypothetical protein